MDTQGFAIIVWLVASPWGGCRAQRARSTTTQGVVPSGYSQELAPWPQDGSPLHVNFSLKVNNIQETDDKQTAVIIDSYFRVTWRDWRLNYPDEEEYGAKRVEGQERRTIVNPVVLDAVWLPDPYIFNVRQVRTVRLLQKEVRGVLLYPDGTVFVSTLTKIDLGCSAKFSKYPFDEQSCHLAILSYMYEAPALAMRWLPNGLVVDPRVQDQLTNFDYSFVIAEDNSTCLCYMCIPPDAPCVLATLTLSRKVLGHLLSTFLPSGLFVAVSYASLYWPADVIPGRTVLVITSLLTLVSMHTGVRQSSPETSYMKAVDVWMIVCIVFSVLMLFEYGLVLLKQKEEASSSGSPLRVSPRSVSPRSAESARSKHSTQSKITFQKVSPVPQVKVDSWQTVRQRCGVLDERKIERWTKIFAPVMFVFFNVIYWPYYLI